jgi:hypothetical protein
VRTQRHLFIWLDTVAAYVIPVRDLPAGMSKESAQSILRDLKAQVVSDPKHPSTLTPLRDELSNTSRFRIFSLENPAQAAE